ncbi:hypothetical protein BC828DRAFT_184444 [Blastocladiella britannica]|nr:hypothetical protein BC828DRAFT_184444 [Blastocladiella britannica]
MTKPLATAAGSSAPTSTVSAATAVEATSTPALASTSTDGNPPLDPPAAAPNGSAALGSIGRGATAAAPVDDRTIDDPENGFGALRGHRASVAYKYAAPDAVVMDAAPPASLVTPLDELENPFASTTFVTTSTSSGSSSSHGNAHDTPTTTTTPASPVPGSPVHSTSSPGGGTGPGTPGTPGTAYVTGRDAQGQLQYRFLEPLFPMVPNHHPLLSQMCQVGGIDPMVLDLAEQCLQWDPRRRATALGLLMHPLLRDVL